jgi:hypothetical protein
MKFKVYFRYDFEHPPMAHHSVVKAISLMDAEGVVKFIAAKNGHHVVIIKSHRLEGLNGRTKERRY